MTQASALDYTKRIATIRDERTTAENEMMGAYTIFPEMERRIEQYYGGAPQKLQGGLSPVQRVLVSLGQAILCGQESSIEWTVSRALALGASTQMLRDVIDVSLLNGGGLAVAHARFAHEVLKHHGNP